MLTFTFTSADLVWLLVAAYGLGFVSSVWAYRLAARRGRVFVIGEGK